MTIRSWVNPWTTPGQSESTRGSLDRRIGRDLVVGRNVSIGGDTLIGDDLHVEGDFQLDGNFVSWQSYTPNLVGYQSPAGLGTPVGQGGPKVATGINYSSTGRYAKIGRTIVLFDFVVTVNARGPNWTSNPYIDLPPSSPVKSQFQASGAYHNVTTSPNDDSLFQGVFAVAKLNATSILCIPVNTLTTAVAYMSQFTPIYQFSVSGSYESA
jgi:hypothetical protein